MFFRRSKTFLEELLNYYQRRGLLSKMVLEVDLPVYGGVRFLYPPEQDPYPTILWIGKTIQTFAGFHLADRVVQQLKTHPDFWVPQANQLIIQIRSCRWAADPIVALRRVLMSYHLNTKMIETFQWTPRSLQDCWPILQRETAIKLSKLLAKQPGYQHPILSLASFIEPSVYRRLIVQELLQQVNLFGYELPTNGPIVETISQTILPTVISSPDYTPKSGSTDIEKPRAVKINGHITLFAQGVNLMDEILLGSLRRMVSLDLLLSQIECRRLRGIRLPSHRTIIQQGFQDGSLDLFFGDTPTLMEIYESRPQNRSQQDLAINLLLKEINWILRSFAAEQVDDNDFQSYLEWWEQDADCAGLTISMTGEDLTWVAHTNYSNYLE